MTNQSILQFLVITDATVKRGSLFDWSICVELISRYYKFFSPLMLQLNTLAYLTGAVMLNQSIFFLSLLLKSNVLAYLTGAFVLNQSILQIFLNTEATVKHVSLFDCCITFMLNYSFLQFFLITNAIFKKCLFI